MVDRYQQTHNTKNVSIDLIIHTLKGSVREK